MCTSVVCTWEVGGVGGRGKISGNQSVSGSLVLSVLHQSDPCVRVCALQVCMRRRLLRVCLCERAVAIQDAWSEEPSCPSRHSQSPLHRGPPTGPSARHTSTHTRQRHTSVSQCSWGPITRPVKPEDRMEPACGAVRQGLHTHTSPEPEITFSGSPCLENWAGGFNCFSALH